MKKSKLFLMTGLCLTLCACTIACTNNEAPETTTTATTTTTTTAPAPVDKGTLSIPQVYAWVDYPDSDFYPVFSIPASAKPLTYTYDTEGISIDAKKNTVKALKEGEYTVIAKSESFETEFKVIVEKIDRSEKGANGKVKFSASEYASQAGNRKTQWKDKGVDGKTTVFIGDSFFDTAFWSNFYNVSYPGKDALCLGISATTTYDWEEWITRGWLSDVKPKNIVMHMGTNNVYDDGEDVAGTVSSLQRMFTLMHEQFPDVPIYWFGISQRSYDLEKIAAVKKINQQMQAWCDARDYITYIDTPSQLKNDMLKDNVHPKVEHYSIFVDALAKTDIVIGDAEKVEETTVIEDIELTTGQSINNGSSLNTITYKNEILSANYVLEGKLDIIKRATNAHIQFGILDNGNERILLWDNNSDGNVKLVIPYNTNVPAEDIYQHQNGSTLTLSWKIVATDDDVYFYINDELKLVYAAQKGLSSHPLTIGSEGVECKFYDMKAITKAADPDAFAAALGEMADVIDQYRSKTAAEKIRA